ncbi:PBP1A family penicillin-binding protein [Niallia sp. Krafla_26]
MKRYWNKFSPPITQWLLKLFNKLKYYWKKVHLTQILILGVLTVTLTTIVFFAYTASKANVQSLQEGLSQTTIIHDNMGNVAAKVDANRTEGVNVKDLPDHVSNAVIAIEDWRFKEHNGFDVMGITRAFIKNLLAGEITGGGSTITQQLAKNALLSHEQTLRRKVEELFLAVEIEKHYTKDEILSMYLNQVYFGSGAWGIDHASMKYFNKNIKEVSISEAAMLAGLLQSPSALDPYKHYERAMNRRDVVLNRMKELEMITEEQFISAKNEKIVLEDGGESYIKREYPYYVDAVIDEAISKYGLTQEEIITRGYHIYTEMDQNLQSSLEKVYNNKANFPTGKGDTLVQSGAVLLDPKTGGVRALVGGRGDYVFRGFNRATHMKVQPGSTLKPLAVYTPALEEGYEPTSVLKDEKMTFADYAPTNVTGTYQGEVPMYKAVEQSINLSAVWLLNEIGLEKGIDMLGKFGIPLEPEDHYLGIALGGMSKGVSPLQLAEAYSTFANDGKREEGHLISKIEGPTGKVIAEYDPVTVRVTTKKVANEMTSMLLGVVEEGTGKGTKIPGVQIAGKTGSTQLPYQDLNGTKDQWFVGYTPNLVGAVWLGYDKTDREHYLQSGSSKTVVPLFKTIMEQSLPYIEKEEFEVKSIQSSLKEKELNKDKQEEPLKDQTNKLKEKIKEEAPKWKEKLKHGSKDLEEFGEKLKEQFEDILNN